MSAYDRIEPFEHRSFYADVRGGVVRFNSRGYSEEYSEVDVLIEASQIPALVIWLQDVQLAPFKPVPEPDSRGMCDPALETFKPLTTEEMRKLEKVREMMDNDRMRQRACPEAKEKESAPTEHTARWKPDGTKPG